MNIKKEIDRLCLEHDINIKTLAELMGIPYQNLYYKLSKDKMTTGDLNKIEKALNVTISLNIQRMSE